MATLSTTMEYFDKLLGEQLLEGEGGGGGETWNTVFEGSVTTEGEGDAWGIIPNISAITADSIRVTFNGVEYNCEKVNGGYGAPWDDDAQEFDFSTYPFFITETEIHTQTAGTYSLKIEEPQSGGSSDFSTAEVTVIQGTASPDAGVIRDVPVINNDKLQVLKLDGSSPFPETKTVVLYKGSLILDADVDTFISASGNASYDSDNEQLTITGDCSLTLSYVNPIV